MRSILALLVAVAWLSAIAPEAHAHEVRPAYLEVRETGPETYAALWKVPALGESFRLSLSVELPDDCERLGEPRVWFAGDAHIEKWTFRRPGGLTGARIRIVGLETTQTDVLVRVERRDGTQLVQRLTPSSTAFTVTAAPGGWEVTRTYALLGVEHILTGFDHLLFVLALLILTGGGWRLVKTVTAFTLSHGLTLTLATLGYVHLPQRPVEAVIALSIVFVAAEILRARAGKPSLTERAPWVVAFAFGLMHGLGFAGALTEVGLPQAHIPTALLCFSLGVEVGHLLFIGAVLAIVALARRFGPPAPRWSKPIPAYVIGSVAMFWLLQRSLPL